MTRRAAVGAGLAALLAVPVLSELRLTPPTRPLTDAWQQEPVAPRGSTLLGISFRPLQAAALGLDPRRTLEELLSYPFHLIRLGAYWSQLEPEPGHLSATALDELDRHLDLAERAGKQIILSLGAVKTFGYPECFVPAHHLSPPLPEGARITPATHPALLAAAIAFLTRLVERERDRRAIIAWQVEHEAVDPLGLEHSWRLAADFVREEVRAVRAADPTRPILLNGFLPTSTLVSLQQWWRTRDQGDSLAVAQRHADIIGIDYYPRHALVRVGPLTAYLDGSASPWLRPRRRRLFAWASAPNRQLIITEGQAEPWETVTTPPSPPTRGMYSCLPERVIANYNQCMRWAREHDLAPHAYLFWGAEYWLLRQRSGDPRYLQAFRRILDRA